MMRTSTSASVSATSASSPACSIRRAAMIGAKISDGRRASYLRGVCSSSSSGSAGGNSAGGSKSGGVGKRGERGGRAKQPGLFEVQVVTPPPRSLGIYALPPLTHNGEEINVDGLDFVVTALVVQFKLERGKYVRNHNRLDVQPTGRWLLNQQLDSLLKSKLKPDGKQD